MVPTHIDNLWISVDRLSSPHDTLKTHKDTRVCVLRSMRRYRFFRLQAGESSGQDTGAPMHNRRPDCVDRNESLDEQEARPPT